MNEQALEWAAAKYAELRPSKWQGALGAIEQHHEQLGGLDSLPANDDQAAIIFDAHMADPISWDFAKVIIQMQLRAGIPLHPLLARIAALMIDGKRPEWTKGRNANYDRDCIAIAMMQGLRDQFGIKPTRNPVSTAICGADLVVEVMNRDGLCVTLEGIIKVWTNRKLYR